MFIQNILIIYSGIFQQNLNKLYMVNLISQVILRIYLFINQMIRINRGLIKLYNQQFNLMFPLIYQIKILLKNKNQWKQMQEIHISMSYGYSVWISHEFHITGTYSCSYYILLILSNSSYSAFLFAFSSNKAYSYSSYNFFSSFNS